MKIAHLIMAYKNPSQLERLINRLSHPQCDVFIHLDKKIDYKEYEYLNENKQVNFIQNRIVCNWGGFSLVRAITNSTKEILLKEEKYDFINLLSAQDYPIKPIESLYAFLENNMGMSYIEFEEEAGSEWWKHAKERFELFHFPDVKLKGKYRVQNILNRIMPRRKFPIACNLYGSAKSSWWTMSRDCAEFIVRYLEENPKLMKFMRYTWAGDEFLYPTIIINSPFEQRVKNNNLRYIRWENGNPSPTILKCNDLEALRNSDYFFARKFDITVDTAILDKIDEFIGYKQYMIK